jgi:DNA-binding IclR family transcriptional regulator
MVKSKKTVVRTPSSARLARDAKGGVSGSLLRGIEILRAFKPGHGYLGNSELTAATGLPKATVSRITSALVAAGYLEFNPVNSKYSLRARALTIGFSLLSNLKIIPVAHEQMQLLANQLGCTVSLAAPDDQEMIYLHRCSNDALPYFLSAGSTIEMARTASGRTYLSTLSPKEREHRLSKLAPSYERNWPTIIKEIEAAIGEYKEYGFCIVDRTWNKNIRSIAAPLISSNGRDILTISCAAPIYVVDRSRLIAEWGPRLLHAVDIVRRHF